MKRSIISISLFAAFAVCLTGCQNAADSEPAQTSTVQTTEPAAESADESDAETTALAVASGDDTIAADPVGRMSDPEVREIADYLAAYSHQMCKAERMYREGTLPKRICHCDTKVNNMMFDADGNVLCVIDLDTVMPSFVFSDFGDFLRTAANTAPEDEPDTDKIDFRMDIFKAFAKGYIESTKSFLTPIEKDNLPYAATLFPYMQAVRFLADYINGDTYYHINFKEHNLVRTKAQYKLYLEAKKAVPAMAEYIASL
jgi:Ser/Thr protein kinase RdoA (MazF antagonist)